jgi:hypothetical protein
LVSFDRTRAITSERFSFRLLSFLVSWLTDTPPKQGEAHAAR